MLKKEGRTGQEVNGGGRKWKEREYMKRWENQERGGEGGEREEKGGACVSV